MALGGRLVQHPVDLYGSAHVAPRPLPDSPGPGGVLLLGSRILVGVIRRRVLIGLGKTYGLFLGVVLTAARRLGASRLPAGPAPTLGVLVASHVALVGIWLGPVGPAVVAAAGIGAAALARSRLRHRPLSDAERRLAERVFGPADWFDDVVLTDLPGRGGRAFVVPGADGRTYVNLGARIDATLEPGGSAYPAPGQLLVHELVHAWQVAHARSAASYLRDAMAVQVRGELGEDVYRLRETGDAHHPWADLDMERQATIVDRWFGGQYSPAGLPCDPDSPYAALTAQVRAGGTADAGGSG